MSSSARLRLLERLPVFFLLLGLLVARGSLGAEPHAGSARVQGILGQAQFSKGDRPFAPLGPGMVLHQGDVVQTATSSAVDLYLGDIPGTVRLTESGTLVLERLSATNTNSGGNFVVQLALRHGELLGLSKSVPADSQFEIKVSNGIAHVVRGRFRVDARGNFVLLEGKALFAHVPSSGEPVAHTLTAPGAVYFSPAAGVQPAPGALQREVVDQMRSKLPRR